MSFPPHRPNITQKGNGHTYFDLRVWWNALWVLHVPCLSDDVWDWPFGAYVCQINPNELEDLSADIFRRVEVAAKNHVIPFKPNVIYCGRED